MSSVPRSRWMLLSLFTLVLTLAGCAQPPSSSQGTNRYLFCFWNTENFFDNHNDGRKRRADQEFDTWFASRPEVFRQKVKNLTEVLRGLNDGKGPDILALAEVETRQAAQALADALNQGLPEGTPPYQHVLWENPHGGRSIATAILTRLPVIAGKTRLLGKRLRILEGHVQADGQELVVLATHWTSRVSDKVGTGRAKYADLVYGRFRSMYQSNPRVALLVCGDFNDNPDDVSVTEHLHATGDLAQVRAGGEPPLLYDLFANLWQSSKGTAKTGTHFYRGKASIFDHLVVSPGMVNGTGGWQCVMETAAIVKHRFLKRNGQPLAFGNEKEKVPLASRGVSDHLPVTVQLQVTP